MKKCKNCGFEIKDVLKFCPECGSNILEQEKEELDILDFDPFSFLGDSNKNENICPECGTVVKKGKFCPECGTDVTKKEEKTDDFDLSSFDPFSLLNNEKPTQKTKKNLESKENICPECGTVVKKGKFCPECGTDVTKKEEKIDDFDLSSFDPFSLLNNEKPTQKTKKNLESKENICPECGTVVKKGKFCPECGTDVTKKEEKTDDFDLSSFDPFSLLNNEKPTQKTKKNLESKENICPECGTVVKKGKFCPECGTDVTKKEEKIDDFDLSSFDPFSLLNNEKPTQKTKKNLESKGNICPECGTLVKKGKFCPECGTDVTKKEEKIDDFDLSSFDPFSLLNNEKPTQKTKKNLESKGNICPECGTVVKKGKFCPECGTVINKKDEIIESDGITLSDMILNPDLINKVSNSKLPDYQYREYDDKIIIEKYINMIDVEVKIPDNVVMIDEQAFEGSYVTKVELPKGLKVIGRRAFANCKYLEKINIPNTVTSIHEEAFMDSSKVSIKLPIEIEIIGDNAFVGTKNEKTVFKNLENAREKQRQKEEELRRKQEEEIERKKREEYERQQEEKRRLYEEKIRKQQEQYEREKEEYERQQEEKKRLYEEKIKKQKEELRLKQEQYEREKEEYERKREEEKKRLKLKEEEYKKQLEEKRLKKVKEDEELELMKLLIEDDPIEKERHNLYGNKFDFFGNEILKLKEEKEYLILPSFITKVREDISVNSSLKGLALPDDFIIDEETFNQFKSIKYLILPANLKKLDEKIISNFTKLEYILISCETQNINLDIFKNAKKLRFVEYLDNELSQNFTKYKDNTVLQEVNIEFINFRKEYIKNNSKSIKKVNEIISNTKKVKPSVEKLIIDSYFEVTDHSNGRLLVKYTGKEKKITIPESINLISPSAFIGCDIESITMTGKILELSNSNFVSVSNTLKEVYLSDYTTKINGYTFSKCKNLKYVKLGKNIEIIDSSAFEYCSSLETVVIPENVTNLVVGWSTFNNCENLKNFDFDRIGTIKHCGFKGCTSLINISLSNCRTIESSAFQDCVNLEEINLPNCSEFGVSAFHNCTKLKKVNNSKAYKIYRRAFAGCTSLESFEFGNVSLVDEEAFDNCQSLTSITIHDTISQYAKFHMCNVFTNCDNLKVIYYSCKMDLLLKFLEGKKRGTKWDKKLLYKPIRSTKK